MWDPEADNQGNAEEVVLGIIDRLVDRLQAVSSNL
jgi:hypothetical protein